MPTQSATQQIVRVLNVGQIARGLPITFNALPGIVGTPGPVGPPGESAYTTLTNAFVMPVVGTPVNVTVGSCDWMVAGGSIYVAGAGYFTVQSIFDAQHATLINSGSPGNVAQGTVIAPGGGVGASGSQGGIGPSGPQGIPGPTGPAGPQGTGVLYRGNWTTGTAYAINDSVSYGGSSYVALKSSTGIVPGTDPTTWNIFAAQGQTGVTGAPGAQGPQGAVGATGPAGPASTTTTSAVFTQPDINGTVSVLLANTSWIPIGSVIYIVGGGYYVVNGVPDATHATLQNPGWTGNASAGSTVSSGALVAAGGVQGAAGSQGATGALGPQGPSGTPGPPAYAILQAGFTVPAPGSIVTLQVDSTAWIAVGLYLFVNGAGYYQVNSIVGANAITATNMGYSGNAAQGATIAGGNYVYAGGAPQTINREYYHTDFENGWSDWTLSVPTGGSATMGAQIDPDSQGIMVGSTAAGVSNWFATLGTNLNMAALASVQLGNRVTFFHGKLRIPVLSNATDTFSVFLGWQSAQATNFQNGIFFYYSSAGSTPGHWGCYARRGGTQVFSDSGVTMQVGYWYDLELTIDTAFATFAIAAYAIGTTPTAPVMVAQIAISQIPAIGAGLAPQLSIVKTAGTAQAASVNFDAYEHEILYAGAVKFKMPALAGPKGLDVTTGTTAPFNAPAIGNNVTIAVLNSSWMAPGQTIYIAGAGAYQVVSLPDATHALVQNLGSTGNTAANTLINSGASVAASGVAGPQGVLGPQGIQGIPGQPAASNLSASFVQPAAQASVNIQAASTVWMVPNSIVYVNGGGYYLVNSVPSSTTATITNMGVTGNASPGATVINNALLGAAGFQGAPGSGPTPVGCVMLYGANALPQGWLNCDGSPQSAATYPELYNALGGTSSPWGVNVANNTFNLPDLRSRVPVGQGQGAGLTNRVIAALGGEELHPLTIAELATHTHTQPDHYHTIPGAGNHTHSDSGHTHTFNGVFISGNQWAASPPSWGESTNTTGVGYAQIGYSGNITPNTAWEGQTMGAVGVLSNTGSGTGHNNMPPFAVMSYIIKAVQEVLVAGPVVPPADTTQPGLLRKLSGLSTDYVGGDNTCHDLPTAVRSAMAIIQVRNFNALGNPNFEIDARTVGTGMTAAAGTVNLFAQDRWALNKNGPLTATAKQIDASASPILLPGTSFAITRSFLRVTITTAEPTLGAGDYLQIIQYVEGPRLRELISGTHSISLLARCSAVLNFGVTLRDAASANSLAKLGAIATANSWTVVSLPNIPVWTPSATWSLNAGVQGYFLIVNLACGSTYTAPANDAWQTGNFTGALGQGNLAVTNGATFDLAFIQHEPGAVCNPFIDLDWEANADRCLRYYQKTFPVGIKAGTVTTVGSKFAWFPVATGSLLASMLYPKMLAKAATPIIWNPQSGNPNNYSYNSGVGDTVVNAIYNPGDSGYSGFTSGGAPAAGSTANWHHTVDTGW